MLDFLTENAGTLAVSLLLAALTAWIIAGLRRDRKRGRSACGGNCGACPMASSCHKPS